MVLSFRAVIEILGKPREHVESTLKGYVDSILKNTKYTLLHQELMEATKHSEEQSRVHAEGDLWTAFCELELSCKSPSDVLHFCFDYMPSVVEILEPEEIMISDVEFGSFLNDLQSRLHQVDMMAKQIKGERDIQVSHMSTVMRNFLLFILKRNNYDVKVLSLMTGVAEKPLEDFLKSLVSDGVLEERAGFYTVSAVLTPVAIESESESKSELVGEAHGPKS